MALQRGLGIVPGETWTGKNGAGPTVMILGIDPDKAEVHYQVVPTDPRHPYGQTDLSMFVRNYRRVTGQSGTRRT